MSTQTISGFIGDGYDERASIAAQPGLWQAMRFTFRPMLPLEYGQFVDFANRNSDEKAKEEIARRLATKIVDWDLRDVKDRPVPVTQANLQRIKPLLLVRLWNIVCGMEPGDGVNEAPADLSADLGN